MIIIRNRFFPFGKNFFAINICGVLFAKGTCSPEVINHEKIHTAQIVELAVLFFYLWYGAEWLYRFIKAGDSFTAYKNISFEREAYKNGDNLQYLSRRRRYAFLKYL